jgi:hypothetical protein
MPLITLTSTQDIVHCTVPIHSFNCLFIRSFVSLFVHSFICSFVHLFICSFVRSFIRSFICSPNPNPNPNPKSLRESGERENKENVLERESDVSR